MVYIESQIGINPQAIQSTALINLRTEGISGGWSKKVWWWPGQYDQRYAHLQSHHWATILTFLTTLEVLLMIRYTLYMQLQMPRGNLVHNNPKDNIVYFPSQILWV